MSTFTETDKLKSASEHGEYTLHIQKFLDVLMLYLY